MEDVILTKTQSSCLIKSSLMIIIVILLLYSKIMLKHKYQILMRLRHLLENASLQVCLKKIRSPLNLRLLSNKLMQ